MCGGVKELWGDDEVRCGGGGEREWGRCRGVEEVRGDGEGVGGEERPGYRDGEFNCGEGQQLGGDEAWEVAEAAVEHLG
jgi:hypothetical protein